MYAVGEWDSAIIQRGGSLGDVCWGHTVAMT
jgi:hypothetical protein